MDVEKADTRCGDQNFWFEALIAILRIEYGPCFISSSSSLRHRRKLNSRAIEQSSAAASANVSDEQFISPAG
jgi:hypothetical protein